MDTRRERIKYDNSVDNDDMFLCILFVIVI